MIINFFKIFGDLTNIATGLAFSRALSNEGKAYKSSTKFKS